MLRRFDPDSTPTYEQDVAVINQVMQSLKSRYRMKLLGVNAEVKDVFHNSKMTTLEPDTSE
jgi:hypothetical protein